MMIVLSAGWRRGTSLTGRLAGHAKLALCLAASGWLAAGCGGAAAAPVKLTSAELAVLSNSGLSGSAAAQVNNAVETLVMQCMQAKGLAYYPNILTAADETGVGPSLAGLPQAYIGLPAREANGYGFYSKAVQAATAPAGKSGSQAANQEEQYAASLPKSTQKPYLLALDGPDSSTITVTLPGGVKSTVPTGGCEGIAERRIYGSIGNYVLGVTGAGLLTDTLLNAVTADPAFTTAISGWSACMNKLGYKYGTPEGLWNSLATKIAATPTPEMRDLEVKIAVADYNCSAALKLIPTVKALQTQHASQLSGTLLQNLASITQIETTALDNAKSLHLGT